MMVFRISEAAVRLVEKEVKPVVHPDGTMMATVIGQWQPWPVLAEAFAEVILWYVQTVGERFGSDLHIEKKEDGEGEGEEEDEDEGEEKEPV